MDLSELERLVQIVQSSSIRDLTLRQGESRLTLRKTAPPAGSYNGPGELITTHGAYSYETEIGDEGEENQPTEEDPEERTFWVTAPLVGVFHHIKPLVGLGAKVKQGQVVGVIEAMKLITEVTCSGSGVVVDTLIEDGLPVEYGQHLFVVERDIEITLS